MEVSPRAGGNRLAEILNYATDIDIIEAEICKAVNDHFKRIHEPIFKGYYAIIVLHSEKKGVYKSIEIDSEIKEHIIEEEIRVKAGDIIEAFNGANNAIGTLFLRFDSRKSMMNFLEHHKKMIRISME